MVFRRTFQYNIETQQCEGGLPTTVNVPNAALLIKNFIVNTIGNGNVDIE